MNWFKMIMSSIVFAYALIRFTVFYVLCLLYSVLVVARLAWSLVFENTSYCFTPKKRLAPSALTSDEYGEHKYMQVNGIMMHYVEKGDKSKPLMLFIHGFPEFWYSWRYQIKEFSKDYRTVAMDLRGYGDSEKPDKISEYHQDKIIEDIRQLVVLLDCKTFTLVAHDYGGVIASKFVLKHMDMIDKYVIIGAGSLRIFEKLISYNWYQFKASWYTFFFQMRKLPELALQWNDFKRLEVMGIPDDLEAYKYTFSKKNALTYAINYYRANINIFAPDTYVKRPDKFAPGLLLLGEHDVYVHRKMETLMMKHYDNMQFQFIKNANHFAQQHQPEETNRIIHEFLKAMPIKIQ